MQRYEPFAASQQISSISPEQSFSLLAQFWVFFGRCNLKAVFQLGTPALLAVGLLGSGAGTRQLLL